MHMDPSVCRLHPGVAVTGFCPACLRDRLAGLHPPSAADLRRCKSFSYARSAAAVEPQRRSCDLFRQQQQPIITVAVPEAEEDHHQQPAARLPHQAKKSSLGGLLLGKKLWRRKSNKDPAPVPISMPLPEIMDMPAAVLRRHRASCDAAADPRRASWDTRSTVLGRLPVEEEDDDGMAPAVPRSDGQIPVEEDYCYYDNTNMNMNAGAAVPGGSVQTRDYYMDSSSSSRRRRSVDRSTASGRNSFSDANNGEVPMVPSSSSSRMINARVSPAAYHSHEVEAHHHHHHQYCRDDDRDLLAPNNLRGGDGFSGSFGSAFRRDGGVPASKPSKKGIKGWSIWGLIGKKSSKHSAEAAAARGGGGEYPCPELRARGYNGQMLRCNSSISARSSFSGSGGVSGRRSISGVDMRDAAKYNGGLLRTRRDEVLLERTLSTRSSSYSRSGHHDLDPAMALPPSHMGTGMQYHHQQHHQLSRPPNIPRRSSSKHESSSLPSRTRRSTLGV